MTDSPENDVALMLQAWAEGDQDALDRLFPLGHREIAGVAHAALRREGAGRAFQTTELVNEAYLRLVKQTRTRWQSRSHFFAVAAQVMRRILVDEARARKSEKRGAGLVPLSLDAMPVEPGQAPHDITDLDDALRRLTVLDPRQGQLVELHVFGGLTYDEIGEVLHISARTVRREWGSARAWLGRELAP
jgi:RNA polymerase sigma-70 factor (ECF subfamily)